MQERMHLDMRCEVEDRRALVQAKGEARSPARARIWQRAHSRTNVAPRTEGRERPGMRCEAHRRAGYCERGGGGRSHLGMAQHMRLMGPRPRGEARAGRELVGEPGPPTAGQGLAGILDEPAGRSAEVHVPLCS